MESPSDTLSSREGGRQRVAVEDIARLRERLELVIDAGIARLSDGDEGRSRGEAVVPEFLSAMRAPHPARQPRIIPLVQTLDSCVVHGPESNAEPDAAAERLLLLLATQRSMRERADRRLPVSVQLQLMSFWLTMAVPAKRSVELFRRGTNTFESACETAVLERIPAGQLSWIRSGLPRRNVLDLAPASTLPFLAAILLDMKGFKPMYFTHANAFRRNRFIMLEVEARRSYLRMGQAMRAEPDIKGLVTVSWYHDPDLPRVSPHLSWMNAIIQEGGGVVYRGGVAHESSGTFENSTARQAAAGRGDYEPREGIVLWPRNAMLAWVDRHEDIDDDAKGAQRLAESLDSAESLRQSL